MPNYTKNLNLFKYDLSTDGNIPFDVQKALNDNWDILDEKSAGSGFNLFDTKLVDHVLTGEEAEGWALQGTWVNKNAVAGSSAGYPDFYNKCLEEYNEAEDLLWEQPKATANTTVIEGGQMVITASSESGNWAAYLGLNGTSTTTVQGWATNGSNIAGWWQVKFPHKIKIIGLKYYRRYSTSADNAVIGRFYTSSDKTNAIGDQFSVPAGANAQYSLGIVNIPDEGIITDTIYLDTQAVSGSYGGMDHLEITATYASLKKNLNGHVFYDISQKSMIDNIFSSTGTAWFYGIDIANERVFLPRNNYFEQATADVSEVGKSIEAGLPNITGSFETSDRGHGVTGAFTTTYGAAARGDNNGSTGHWINLDASRSNAIYGKSDTVQPNAVNKLLYICVANNMKQQALGDIIEVTTTENDTIPLFTGMYFDFKPNNVCWLKAGQQQNDGGIYKTCYAELVNVLNGQNKYGDLKVIDTTKMITGVDYSEYWKVNQTNKTFITPTAIGLKAYNNIAGVAGNGMTLGLTDGTNNFGVSSLYTNGNSLYAYTNGYGATVGTSSNVNQTNPERTVIGVTTDPTKSGMEAQLQQNTQTQLYFKVANAVQNLELLDVGEVMEAVADKISRQDCPAYITETYQNGASWYRVYSDGWCEQGSVTAAWYRGSTNVITFLKTFKSVSTFICNLEVTTGEASEMRAVIGNTSNNGGVRFVTTTQATVYIHGLSGSGTDGGPVHWYACGYIS